VTVVDRGRGRDLSAPLFFLSYAHSGPPADGVDADADLSVNRFFRHLEREVGARAADPPAKIGFLDQEIQPGENLKARLSQALASAEVFVPLYSPRYFANPRPFREQQIFESRQNAHGTAVANQQHILPVLWTPFPPFDRPPEIAQILRLGPSIEAYRDLGLRALCLVESEAYSRPYEQVVSWLATEIVRLAEESPLGPAVAPEMDDVPGRGRSAPAFVVAYAGPSWLAELGQQAAALIERLGFATRVVPLAFAVKDLANAPGLVLTDAMDATPGTAGQARATLPESVPEWALPVLVRSLSGIDDLASELPTLVARARRTFLRRAPAQPPRGVSQRPPRLRDASRGTDEESDQDD
jgi:TIR domain-containing protein